MFITKRFVFKKYDTTRPAWKNHSRLLAHEGMECTGYFLEDDEVLDMVEVKFDDGFKATVYMDELKEIK